MADVDGDGIQEIIVTVSDEDSGARLVAYHADGRRVAISAAIGRGYRWLHQVAAGALGASDGLDVVVIRTTHIGGIVQAFRLEGDRSEVVAELRGLSSHVLGSPNLDMALLADATGDGTLEVIAPSQDMRSLGVISRTVDGFENGRHAAARGLVDLERRGDG